MAVCSSCTTAGNANAQGAYEIAKQFHLECPAQDPAKRNACDCQHRTGAGLTRPVESVRLEVEDSADSNG